MEIFTNEVQVLITLNRGSSLNFSPGVYQPPQCRSTSEPCGIVFTSHYIDNYFFIRIIEALNLKMEIYFMGDKLKKTIYNLSKIIERNNIKKSFLVLHWTPSEIIDGRDKFSFVEMPPCEVYKDINNEISCKMDSNIVSVLFTNDFSSDFSSILQNLKFKSLKVLMRMYDEKFLKDIDVLLTIKSDKYSHLEHNETDLENIYNEIACKYMQLEKDYYSDTTKDFHWFEDPNEFEIKIGGM